MRVSAREFIFIEATRQRPLASHLSLAVSLIVSRVRERYRQHATPGGRDEIEFRRSA